VGTGAVTARKGEAGWGHDRDTRQRQVGITRAGSEDRADAAAQIRVLEPSVGLVGQDVASE
jgi:hypothetical protein